MLQAFFYIYGGLYVSVVILYNLFIYYFILYTKYL